VLNPDFAFEVCSSEAYHLRDEDIFGSAQHGVLSKEAFQRVAELKRDKILPNSLRTRMFEFLRQLMSKLFFEAINTPYHSSVAIDVNVYPFVLTSEEEAVMIASLAEMMHGHFTINLINKSPAQLDPEYVREHYRAMITYTYHEWMNHWDKEIKKKPLKDMTIFAPRIHHVRAITEKEMAEAGFAQFNLDPFSLLQLLLKTTVLIQHLPIALYCAATPANKPAYAQWE